MSLLSRWLRKPHPLILENRERFARFDQSRPLTDYDFVVLDTELTGLNRRRDEIVSIGAVRIRNLRIDLADAFHSLVRPRRNIPTEATLVHRITPEELRQAPEPGEVLPAFIRYLGGSLVVGHYIELDMHFLNRLCRRILGGTLSNPGVDTMRLAQGYKRVRLGQYHEALGVTHGYNLEDLARECDLPAFKPHDALEDALQTAYLFLFLIKKFRKGGLLTLKELYRAGR